MRVLKVFVQVFFIANEGCISVVQLEQQQNISFPSKIKFCLHKSLRIYFENLKLLLRYMITNLVNVYENRVKFVHKNFAFQRCQKYLGSIQFKFDSTIDLNCTLQKLRKSSETYSSIIQLSNKFSYILNMNKISKARVGEQK